MTEEEMKATLALARSTPAYQLMQWKHALHLELKGLKNSQGSVYVSREKEIGLERE